MVAVASLDWRTYPMAEAVIPANIQATLNEAQAYEARHDLTSAIHSAVVALCQAITLHEQRKGTDWVDGIEMLRNMGTVLAFGLDYSDYALLRRFIPRNLEAIPYGDRYIIQHVGTEVRPTPEEYSRGYRFVVESILRLLKKD